MKNPYPRKLRELCDAMDNQHLDHLTQTEADLELRLAALAQLTAETLFVHYPKGDRRPELFLEDVRRRMTLVEEHGCCVSSSHPGGNPDY